MTIDTATCRAAAASALLLGAVACAPAAAPRSAPSPDEVSIAYGVQDRRDVTGSIATVTAGDLQGVGSNGLVQMLESRVPGLSVYRRPDGDLSLRIRGSVQSRQHGEPLVVIDGMPILSGRIFSAFASIRPQQVLRIDVLKDAGSTAAYGLRGGNGVILITTDRGR